MGRLCIATSTGAVTGFAYNALGLEATTTRAIDGASYVTPRRYDRQGNLTNFIYPDGSEVYYTYNSAGLPATVQQREDGGSFTYVVEHFDHAPTGQVSYKAFGNGVETTYSYDPAELYRLKSIRTMPPSGGGLQAGSSMSITRDSDGHVLAGSINQPLAVATFDGDEPDIGFEDSLEGQAQGEANVENPPPR